MAKRKVEDRKKGIMVCFRPSQLIRLDKLLTDTGVSRSHIMGVLLDKWLEEQEMKDKK